MAAELPSSEEEVQALLQSAVLSRASHIRKEAETITMANVRRLLETDLGLEKSALDAHKLFIRQLVDEVLLSSENAEGQDEEAAVSEEAPKSKKKSSGKKAREGNRSPDQTTEKDLEDLQENDHVEAPRKKKQKKEKAKKEKSYSEEDEDGGGSHAELSEEGVNLEAPKEKSQKSKPKKDKEEIKEVDEDGGGSQSEMSEDSDVSERRKPNKAPSKTASVKPVQNRKLEHLKKIIKACGLTIPPQMYKRAKQQPEEEQDKFLIKELVDILSRRGLSSDPSEKEIKAAKRRIATEKDLEGIDTTNIILEPRGRRATSQLFTPVYNPPPLEYDSEQDDDGKEGDEEDDDNAGSDDEEKDFVAADDSDNSD